MARGVWEVMASTEQVDSWPVAVEARNLTWSSVHRCFRAMSMGREAGAVLRDTSS